MKTLHIIISTALILLFFQPSIADTTGSPSTSGHSLKIGTELDALPFATGGYYTSLWLGYKHLRLRAILTQAYPPEFATADGFEEYDLKVKAFLVDYFPDNNFKGFWIGAGFENWKGNVQNKSDHISGDFNYTIATVGGGYVWKFYRNLYLNPWLAGHLILDKHTGKKIGNKRHTLKRFTPEISIKLGWHF